MTLKNKSGRVRDKGFRERATWGDGIDLVVEKKLDSTETPNLQLTGICCVLCPLYKFFFWTQVFYVKIQIQETWNRSHY